MNEFSNNALSIEGDNQSTSPQHLGVQEWLAVVSILGFMLLLTLIVLDGRHDSRAVVVDGIETVHFLKPQEVEVHIEGSVINPGRYKVKSGTSVMEAIILAEPLEEADLSKIKETSRVKNGLNIHVASRQMVTITVSGAVPRPGVFKILKGTRLSELRNHIEFDENADLSKLAKKRLLKDNEVVIVPVICPKKEAVNASQTIPQQTSLVASKNDKPVVRKLAKSRRTRRLIEAQKHSQRLWSKQ
ncbi:MAG: SLBB domain-containing protein [Parachlamydiaceae bacterium]|nr:SLBB domain-containing protein [Parachlamydiaceae bacterium]